MKIDILTLFPDMFRGPFDESIIRRARDKKLVDINIHNLRDWTTDKHRTVDDRPFGGGAGMVIMIQPVYDALESLKSKIKDQRSKTQRNNAKISSKVVLLTPQGQTFNQAQALELSNLEHLILICGHYEGFDERIRAHLVDEEISIGDYVLTGGELPAMVVTDTVVRLLPGVLSKEEATQFESFSKLEIGKLKIENFLEYPHYTRPAEFKGWKVPKVLLGGNHAEIDKWRADQALRRTRTRRPDLLKKPKSGKIPDV